MPEHADALFPNKNSPKKFVTSSFSCGFSLFSIPSNSDAQASEQASLIDTTIHQLALYYLKEELALTCVESCCKHPRRIHLDARTLLHQRGHRSFHTCTAECARQLSIPFATHQTQKRPDKWGRAATLTMPQVTHFLKGEAFPRDSTTTLKDLAMT